MTETDFLEDFSGVQFSNGTDPIGSEAGTIMNPAGVSAAYSVQYPKSRFQLAYHRISVGYPAVSASITIMS